MESSQRSGLRAQYFLIIKLTIYLYQNYLLLLYYLVFYLCEPFDDAFFVDVPDEGALSRGGCRDTVEVGGGPRQGVDDALITGRRVHLYEGSRTGQYRSITFRYCISYDKYETTIQYNKYLYL